MRAGLNIPKMEGPISSRRAKHRDDDCQNVSHFVRSFLDRRSRHICFIKYLEFTIRPTYEGLPGVSGLGGVERTNCA